MSKVSPFVIAIFLSANLFAQKHIEKYLADQKLINQQQLEKYYQKIKSNDAYVKMMIKLMKKDKSTRSYASEMEKEYRAELEKRKHSNDTLTILLNILEPSCEKRSLAEHNNSGQDLSRFVIQLNKRGLIANKDAGEINSTIGGSSLYYDSCSVMSLVIQQKKKTLATTENKLKELMDTLRILKILSEENYKKLNAAAWPDSISRVKYILSFCDRVYLNDQSLFVRNKNDFFSEINALNKLTGLNISDVKLDFITLVKDSAYFKGIPVITARYKEKQFVHKCYESSTTQEEFDPYSLAGHDYYQIFNRILASFGSPYRICKINEKNSRQLNEGFILLTKEQLYAVYHNEQLEFSFEDFENPLSSEQILNAIDIYKRVGLLKTVPDSTRNNAVNKIGQEPVFRYNELVGRFQDISVTIEERIPLSEQQAIALVKKMAAISDYRFNPQNIRVEKTSSGKSVLLFDERDVITQKHEFDYYIDWQGIWGLIHNVIYSNPERSGYFQPLRFEQYKEVYIYITNEQMKILENEKVINDY